MIIQGTISYRMSDSGSKSEGFRAYLTDAEGRTYSLYRAGHLPYGDEFFQPFDGMELRLSGTYEEATDDFLVKFLILEDGTEIPADEEEDDNEQIN